MTKDSHPTTAAAQPASAGARDAAVIVSVA